MLCPWTQAVSSDSVQNNKVAMKRDPFKKLLANCKMNAVSLDANGEWTKINSSTNKRRLEKTGSSVGGAAGPNSKEWKPSKLMIDENDLRDIWEYQNGRCYWFNIPLDLGLLYKDHPDWYPKHPLAPSVDKINDSGDYTKDNLVICCRFANFGRNVYPFDKMQELIRVLTGGQNYPTIITNDNIGDNMNDGIDSYFEEQLRGMR